MRKRVLSILLCMTMAGTLLAGCGNGEPEESSSQSGAGQNEAGESSGENAAKESETENGERETVNFWYLWSGDGESGAGNIEELIKAYNASQDKYEVIGLSVPDMQKIVTAVSSGTGPDITDAFMTSIPGYAEEQIAMPLDDLIARDNVDLTVFAEMPLEVNQYGGKQYALPINCNPYVLFYNKDLLEEGGYTELPKTMEEVFEIGKALTKVENGQITCMGSPIVGGWLDLVTYSTGYDFGTAQEVVFVNEGVRKAIEMVSEQVNYFGADEVSSFNSSAASLWNSEEDYFRVGNGVFRFDGPWFYKMAVNSGINVGAMMIPGFADQNGQNYTAFDTSNLYIPSTAKNVDGAWDFMKYFAMGDGAKMFSVTDGSIPALKTLLDDSDVIATFDPEGASLGTIKGANLVAKPVRSDISELNTALGIASDSVILGEPVEDIIAELEKAQEAYQQ